MMWLQTPLEQCFNMCILYQCIGNLVIITAHADCNDDPDTLWTGLKNAMHHTALDVFGIEQRQDPDWYRDS